MEDAMDQIGGNETIRRPDADPLATTRPREDSLIGKMLDGRYVIKRELGHGGFGTVYLAFDEKVMSRRVVVKVQLDREVGNEWSVKKFRQEIEALSRVDHPGIVGIFDSGQTPEGKSYIVMQYVDGASLRSAIKVEGMDLQRTANIVRQIGRALNSAHYCGILHRDLKPENIMLQTLSDGEEHVKIIDFGIAKIKNSVVALSTSKDLIAGSIAYMSPEQLCAQPLSPASDIYAFGVIAYEMITGRRPHNPDSVFQLLEMQREGVRVKPMDLRPSLSEGAQSIILKALSFEARDRYQRTQDFGDQLGQALSNDEIPSRNQGVGRSQTYTGFDGNQTSIGEESAKVTRNFAPTILRLVLLYKRNAQPDEHVLKLLEKEFLAREHEVFIDRNLTIGVEWAKEIEQQLRTADAVIALLSAASVTSEMLAYEIQIAHEAAQQYGKPRLLPVRINHDGALPDPLAGYLDPLQYALWRGPKDDFQLVEELLVSLHSKPSIKAPTTLPKLEPVGGAVPLDSEFYILRATDEDFRTAIERHDSIVLIKGARQMGKTSLLARGLQQARESGARVVLTDLQKLNATHLGSIDTLFQTLAELIADQLNIDVSPNQAWDPRSGPNVNFERYVRREVLSKISEPVVWGLDEVDRLFTCAYGSEVFGLFRSWHNARSLDPAGPWRRLTMAIAYATEAHLFITDLNQSPFNVGTRLVLDDFDLEHVSELNRRYGSPLTSESNEMLYYRLVSGHPYLVRRGLHHMVAHGIGLSAFKAHADRDEGPFGDHLRRILVLLAQDSTLCDAFREVLQGRPCPSLGSFYRLRSAGVISGYSVQDARPRCQIYETYLKRHLL
jgi:serine/threonine protein kinase